MAIGVRLNPTDGHGVPSRPDPVIRTTGGGAASQTGSSRLRGSAIRESDGTLGAMELAAATRVPLVDLAPSHDPIRDGVLQDIEYLIATGGFTNGPEVARFER